MKKKGGGTLKKEKISTSNELLREKAKTNTRRSKEKEMGGGEK